MRKYLPIAVLVAATCGYEAFAQEPAAPRSAPTPPTAAAQKEPPCKAVVLSQQDEVLRLTEQITQQQQYIVRLQRALLEQAKRQAEPDIVKEAGGKPGQGWDFTQNVLLPEAPAAAPAKPKP